MLINSAVLLVNGLSDEYIRWGYNLPKKDAKRHPDGQSPALLFQCQPTALLRASGSAQGGYMALSVVYFRITHRLGRPYYVWDEYLYSVQSKVEVSVTVCVTVCVV